MGEKIYTTMKRCGVWNIALGIVMIAIGISVGEVRLLMAVCY